MAALPLLPDEIRVIGWENGGVSVHCKHCDAYLAGGGCDCCADNGVTLADLMKAIEVDHECDEVEDDE